MIDIFFVSKCAAFIPRQAVWNGLPSQSRISVIKSLTGTDEDERSYWRKGYGEGRRRLRTKEDFAALNKAIDKLSGEQIRIVAAAIQHGGRIYTGLRHAQIMRAIWDEQGECKILQEQQGFLTSDGAFLNRFQAAAVAYSAGQTNTRKETLFSEDIW